MNTDPSHHKTDFNAIYDQPDPRAYFTTLEPFDYAIPQHGADVCQHLLSARAAAGEPVSKVLDVCCSYGLLATLLKTDLDVGDLFAHYAGEGTRSLTTAQLTAADQRLLRDHRRREAPRVVGLDVAASAVDYAVGTGALDAGAAENLEVGDPSAELARMVSDVDLVTTTGGVGYVTARTFDRLLEVTPDSAWVASFCLRTYDYEPIARTLDDHGLRTEQLSGTFAQRRFTDAEEQDWAVAEVTSRGIDPTGKETDGYYHADFFLSRPAEQVARLPLGELLPGSPDPAA